MELNGYIKIHRKLVQWGWYSDSVVKDVFLHLLIVAAYKPGQFLGYEILPGQAIIGYQKLSEELGFTIQQVRTAIKKLESTGEIKRKSTNKFSIVTIANWAEYQTCDDFLTNEQQTNNKRVTNHQQTSNKPSTTSKEGKEGKEGKNVKKDIVFTPPTLEEIVEYANKRNSPVDPVKFYDYFTADPDRQWMDAKGKPVSSWKQKLVTWEKYSAKGEPDGRTGKSAAKAGTDYGTVL